jgi:hypothetical protein
MIDDRFYSSEQILIHEFGHTGLHVHAQLHWTCAGCACVSKPWRHPGRTPMLCMCAVMDVGLPADQQEAICAAHRAAVKQQLYDPDCYMVSNSQVCLAMWMLCIVAEEWNGLHHLRVTLAKQPTAHRSTPTCWTALPALHEESRF